MSKHATIGVYHQNSYFYDPLVSLAETFQARLLVKFFYDDSKARNQIEEKCQSLRILLMGVNDH